MDTSIYNGGAFRPYTNAVYLNGANFLDELHARIGEDAFFEFLKDYASQMSARIANRSDFFNILYHHTDEDISDIIQAYFLNP